jgi:hypothetical protein
MPSSATAPPSRPSVCADVEPRGVGSSRRARQERDGRGVDTDADRQIHEEDPVPAERAREHAAEQHADAAAGRAHEAVDAHRLRALCALGEEVHDQGQRDGCDHGAAEPLNGARGDEQPARPRETARDGREREQDEPEQEEFSMPVEIAEPSAEQEKPAEGQHVGVHDPDE